MCFVAVAGSTINVKCMVIVVSFAPFLLRDKTTQMLLSVGLRGTLAVL